MGNVNAGQLSLLVSATMLVATLIYYYRMVLLTELTTEATLFNTLYAEYATPHLSDAIRSVEDFAHNTLLTAHQIVCKKPEDHLWDKNLDRDWQRVHHWYQKLVYFHRMGLLSNRFYKEFPGAARAKHFVQHVEPFALNACKHSGDDNCAEIFDYLRELYALPEAEPVVCDAVEPKKIEAAEKEEL